MRPVTNTKLSIFGCRCSLITDLASIHRPASPQVHLIYTTVTHTSFTDGMSYRTMRCVTTIHLLLVVDSE